MIPIQNHNKEEAVIEQQQLERREKFEQRIIPHKGHKIWMYNMDTGKLSLTEFDNVPTIDWDNAKNKRYPIYRKVFKKENCIYLSALNRKNAEKVLKRDYNIVQTQQ